LSKAKHSLASLTTVAGVDASARIILGW